MIARCSPPWPRRSPWPSPSRLSRRAKIRPGTGAFQTAVRTVLPCHATSLGSPTLTETTMAIMKSPVTHDPGDRGSSTALGNEARHAGVDHRVEADVRRDAFPDLLHGVFRQGRYLKTLLDVARCFRRGQESGTA